MNKVQNILYCRWLIAALILACAGIGVADSLPADSFEWSLANPNDEYELVTGFSGNTPIPEIGGWKVNASATFAEVYKVRGNVGVVFPLAAPDSGTYYVTLGSYTANNSFVLYSESLILESGKTYRVSGYVSSAYAAGTNSGTWTITLGNESTSGELSQLARGSWTYFTFDYVADGSSPSLYAGWIKSDVNHARVLFDGISVREVVNPDGGLPEDSFEWPLDDPNNEYESVSFDAHTPIPALGGWKVNSTMTYAEIYKVKGTVGIQFPLAAPDAGIYYATLGSYVANNAFGLYTDPLTLEPGKTYTVSGYVSSVYGQGANTGSWTVSLGDASISGDLSQLARGYWTYFSFTYVAGTIDPYMSVGWIKSDTNHARICFDGISIKQVSEPSSVLPELTCEWPLDNPNNEYESLSFEQNETLLSAGGWRVSTSSYYAEVLKVQGTFGAVLPLSQTDSGFNYVSMAGYTANFGYTMTSNPITLEPGATYTVSGYISSGYGLGNNSGTWTVSLGSESTSGDLSLLEAGTWTPFSFTYMAGDIHPVMQMGWSKTDTNHARILFDGLTVKKELASSALPPVFAPMDKYLSGSTEVTITAQAPGADIYYTTDGTPPMVNGTVHASPVTVMVDNGTELRAVSVVTGEQPSYETSQSYVVHGIPVVGWYGVPAASTSDENFQTMREAGFTHSQSYTYTRVQEVEAALDSAYEAGMKLIPNFTGDRAYFSSLFKDHPALEAYFLYDEPDASLFASLAAQVQDVATLDADHWSYINLYAGDESYVNSYLSTVPVEVLSFDQYPITTGSVVSADFYSNLERFSQKASTADMPLWCFALSTAHWDFPVPNLSHLRFQMYSNLAYGAQGLQYFTYWHPGSPFSDAPVDTNGLPTATWDVVQSMNQEIAGLSDVFVGAEVVEVGHTGASIPTGTTLYQPSGSILSLTTTGSSGAVVSELTNGLQEYVVIVNRDLANTMTLDIGVDSSASYARVNKDGSFDAPVSGTLQYTVDPADIVVLRKAIPGDVTGDGVVDQADVQVIFDNWLASPADMSMGDLNGDDVVNLLDLSLVIGNWLYGI